MKATSPRLMRQVFCQSGRKNAGGYRPVRGSCWWATRDVPIVCDGGLLDFWTIPKCAKSLWIEASTTETEHGIAFDIFVHRVRLAYGFHGPYPLPGCKPGGETRGYWRVAGSSSLWYLLRPGPVGMLLRRGVIQEAGIETLWITIYWE